MKTLFCVFLFSFILFPIAQFAQLTVQPGGTATQLGNTLAGSNVTITNATINGAAAAYGTFQYSGTAFPMSSGIILATGNVTSATGGGWGASNCMGTAGNTLLTGVAGVQTYDAVEFQFDFEVQSPEIEFKYIFASEEYNEFVGSSFNDVFAFYISGPGITGWQNIALIPNTNVPVAINNVNNGSYWQYFVDNTSGAINIEYDGFTTVLTAKKDSLQVCGVYTLKLVIADAGDCILDAAVFLQTNSLVQGNVSASSNTFSANNTALEGCIDASFTFSLDSARTTATTIPIGIGGTAVNGVDYTHVDTVLVIPAGQTSASVIINALSDGIPEGVESIQLYFSPAPCEPFDTVTLFINDYQTLQYTTSVTNVSCFNANNGMADFTITGGTSPFIYTLTDSASGVTTNYTTDPVTGLAPGTYYIDVADGYGCIAEDVVAGNQYTGGPVFLPDGNGGSYSTTLPISGFSAGATLQNVNQLQSVCVTMEHSRIGELEMILQAPNGTQLVLKQQPGGAVCNMGEPCAVGPADAGNTDTTAGVGYTYCFTPAPTYGTMVAEANSFTYSYVTSCYGTTESDKYLPAGSYTPYQSFTNLIGVPLNGNWTLIVTDNIPNNNGWVFDWSISFTADPPDSIITVTQPNPTVVSYTTVQPNCGSSNGSIDVSVSGPGAPFTYSWSNGATSQDLTNVAAGAYTLSVTNASACTQTFVVTLSSNGALSAGAIVQNQQCASTNTGAINLTVSGGMNPITYSWSNGANTQDLNNLPPGTYAVTVTDGAGCIASSSYTVLPATALYVTGVATNENCGDQEGAVDISVSGGQQPYSYSWNNSANTQDITDVSAGTYSVTVTDNFGCTANSTYTVINTVGNCIPACDLALNNISSSNETCGNGNGNATINVFTTNMPYTIQWNNGANTNSITGLSAGNYSVTVQDDEGCVVTQNFTIQNITNGLTVSNTSVSSEICGNNQGGINITLSGGVQPYSFAWSNGATTEDITGLSAGNYSVTITDANNCSSTQSFTVTNQSGTLQQTYGNAMPSSCNQNNGSIDISITGGQPAYSYQWSNGAVTQDLLLIAAGTYSCVITDAAGCQISTPIYTVLSNNNNLAMTTDVDPEVCSNGQGEILTAVTGGLPPYAYSWNTGAVTPSLNGLSAGTYSVSVTDANGCVVQSGNLNVVNDPGNLQLLGISSTDETCGNNLGNVDLNVSGGTAPVSYLWNTGSVSQDIYGLSAGTYSCTITDVAGCTINASAVVQNNAGTLSINNLVVTNEQCGNNTGAINLLYSGAANPVTISWSNGAVTQNISSLSAGTYSVTVTDNIGCEATSSATVLNNTTNGLSLATVAQINEICGNGNGSIDVQITGGITPYTITWSNAATTEDLTNLSAGTYSVEVTDASNCVVSSSTYTITNSPGSLNLSLVAVTNASCGQANGGIDLQLGGGTVPYTILWSNAATSLDISNISAGNYSVSVSDNAGCTSTGNYTVANTAGNLAVTAQVTDELCNGNNGSVNISVTGGTVPYTYSWSNGASTQDISALNSGVYSYTVTDNAGCQASASYTVGNNPGTFDLVSVNTTDALCGNSSGAVVVSYSGGQSPFSYNWSNGALTKNISGLSAGTYSCQATDANGCFIQFSATVGNDPGTLFASTDSVSSAICGANNGGIYMSVSGGTVPYSYAWNTGSTSQDISSLAAGMYTVTITDAGGCQINHQATVGNGGGQPVISSVIINDEVCGNNNGSISIGVTGGTGPYNYSWTASPCCSYTLQMNDMFGDGWNGSSLAISVNGSPVGNYAIPTGVNTHTVSIPVCNANSISLNYTPGTWENEVSYSLINSAGLTVYSAGPNPPTGNVYNGTTTCAPQNGPAISNLSAATYSVTVTDANGCTTSATATVGSSSGNLSISNAVVTNENCGDGTGAIDITVNSSLPVSISWSNGQITEDLGALNSGVYTVTVTSASGCPVSQTYTVNNITNGLAVTASSVTPSYCGTSVGAIDITLTGGSIPYSFQWSNGANTEDITNISSGTYSVIITDASSCSMNQVFAVTNQTNGLTVSESVTQAICQMSNGAIDLTVSGGVNPYTFSWETGAVTEDISSLAGGWYTYTVTDNSGCATTDSAFVPAQNNGPAITTFTSYDDYCGGGGYIDITVSGGVSPYTFLWSDGTQWEDLFGMAGTHSVTVTGANGCSTQGVFTINSIATFTATAVVTDATCSTCNNGSVNLTVTGAGPFSYNWSNGAFTQDITNVLPGTYTVVIDEAGWCIVTMTYTVGVDSLTTGMNTDDVAMHVNLFPNPTKGMFNVSVMLNHTAPLDLQLTNMLGEVIDYKRFDHFSEGAVQFSLDNEANGIYFLKIRSGTKTSVLKLVLAR